jgi:mannosyl-oligosaccharide alpha-1,2-mannosidase
MFPRTKNSEAKLKKDNIVKLLDAKDLQRPETVESLFILWRITNSPVSGEWGWKIFAVFEKYTLLTNEGYSSLCNVNQIPPLPRSNMESWLVVMIVSSLPW